MSKTFEVLRGIQVVPSPQMIATSLNQSTVLLAVSGPNSPFYRGVARYAKEHSWHLVVDTLYTGSMPVGWRGSGIIVEEGYHGSLASDARKLNLPCVFINYGPSVSGGPRVQCDNMRVGALAAEHLVERGCRNFVWAPFADDVQNHERKLGFDATLGEYGHTVYNLPPAYIRNGDIWCESWEMRRATISRELLELPKGTGIFAHNDCVAAELLQICRELNLNVPGDLAIMGVDNDTLLASIGSVSLTSIDMNCEEIGYQAALLLDQLLIGAADSEQVVRVQPKGIIPRLSTGNWAVEDERVREALNFISENYMNSTLGVQDVADAVGISRRSIERAFRLEVGLTICEYIASIRMQEAARILRTHDRAKVFDVAGLVGFSAPTNFFRRFRRHFGVTPKSYMRRIETPQLAREAC